MRFGDISGEMTVKKIKSGIYFACVLSLLSCATPLTAYADIVWGNNFASKNKEEIEPLGRMFYVDSPNGYVKTLDAPGSHNDDKGDSTYQNEETVPTRGVLTSLTYFNGQRLPISVTYNDNGRYWGLIDHGGHGGPLGWVPMDELLLIYTTEDFMRENEDGFYVFTGSLHPLLQARNLVRWAWPGSDRGRVIIELSQNPSLREEGKGRIVDDREEDILAYTDDSGRIWIYVEIEYYYKDWYFEDYIYSQRNLTWVCLTEPENSGIPAFNPAPDPIRWSPGENQSWVYPEYNDDFYMRYRAHIRNLKRTFIVSSENAYVSVKDGPDLKNEIARLEKGESVFIDYSCLYDGEFWGFLSVPDSSPALFGWVRLNEFLVLYDYVAFIEDNIDDFFSFYINTDTEVVIAWQWPGSGVPLWTVEGADLGVSNITFYYRDADGRVWGFIRHLYGGGNIWVCLTDPVNPDIPAFNPAPAPAIWISDTEHTDIATLTDIADLKNPGILLAVILVVGLVLASIILIFVFWKPKKRVVSND